MVLDPTNVGPLPGYLRYLFLRFPGTLADEQTLVVECFDTYDRRWSRQGQVWIRRGVDLELVTPPSLRAHATDPSVFGLQAPVPLGKATLRVRNLSFSFPGGEGIAGQLIKAGRDSFLVLAGDGSPGFSALEAALSTDGLAPLVPGKGWWVKDPRPAFVAPLALSLPAADAEATPFLLEALRDGLRVARQYERGIIADVDTECLHQYRVHLRRVRSLASLGSQWQVVPEHTRLKNLLRGLQQKTNELRDLDVLLLDLPELRASLPWGEGERLAGWQATLIKARKAEWRRVKAWLLSDEHRRDHEEIELLLQDLARYGEPWSVAEFTTSALGRATRSLKKSLKAVTEDAPDEALHEVRIRTKRLRYVLDTVGSVDPAATKTQLSTLKEAQEGLGRFQDRSLLLARLRSDLDRLRTQPGPVDPWAFGILLGTLAADHNVQRGEALRAAQRLGSSRFLKARHGA